MRDPITLSYLHGALGLLAIYLIFIFFNGFRLFNPFKVVIGKDKRPSTSKLQFFLWTIVILFTAIVFCSVKLQKDILLWNGNIPSNLLLAMGFSIITATAAKGITTSYINTGQLNKTEANSSSDASIAKSNDTRAGMKTVEERTGSWDAVFKDDDGYPDLSKMQMLAWTFIAIGIYLVTVLKVVRMIVAPNAVDPGSIGFPDIDPALMVLMGLGQGAYLGKKLVTTTTPRLSGLSESSGKANTSVEIRGASFGTRDGGEVTIDRKPIDSSLVTDWNDTSIKFKIPPKQPNGMDWVGGQIINIGIIAGGQESVNTLPFTITS
jgi:hypothetical protein